VIIVPPKYLDKKILDIKVRVDEATPSASI
jgi:hypothetical protein